MTDASLDHQGLSRLQVLLGRASLEPYGTGQAQDQGGYVMVLTIAHQIDAGAAPSL